jgi:hypothetical protein
MFGLAAKAITLLAATALLSAACGGGQPDRTAPEPTARTAGAAAVAAGDATAMVQATLDETLAMVDTALSDIDAAQASAEDR